MRLLLAAALGTCLLGGPAWCLGPPDGGPVKTPGLKAAARVLRDTNGIAHVSAGNEHDLFFLQGYVHAQDRLFQMDLTRRRVSGTLAELLGPTALGSDVQLRTVGLQRAAQRSFAVLSPRARAAVEAYAEGVNAWAAANPLPPEYGALEITRFAPWTALDCVAVAKGVTSELSFDLGDIDRTVALLTYQGAGKVVGFDGTKLFFEDLFRSAPFDPASTVPDASAAPATLSRGSARAGSPDPDAAELGRKYLEKLDDAPELRRLLDREVPNGSNEWAVSGALTVDGLPLLANDPHLALGTPSTFYPIHLGAGPLDVIGSSFPGTPFVVVGHNRRIAWGATINPMDVTDVYQEQVVPDPNSPSGLSTVYLGQLEPILPIPEVFRANQLGDLVLDNVVVVPPGGRIPPVTLIVPRRNQGPIIQAPDPDTGKALSLQYTGFSATRELDAILRWNVARGLGDFQEALTYFDCGSINLAYADVEGNIAYFTSAEMPVREDLQAGAVAGAPPYFIRSGLGGNEWLPVQHPQPGQALPYEILPAEEMPHVVNPPAGWFVNANNDPAGTTLDNNPLNQLRPGGGIYYLNPGYDGYRAGRITRMLREKIEGGRRISIDDLKAMQADVELPTAPVFVPHVVQALENAQRGNAPEMLKGLALEPGVQEAVERLSAWDFTAPTGIPEGYDASDEPGNLAAPSEDEIAASVAATLFAVWQGQFLKSTVDAPPTAMGLPKPASQQAVTALRNLLDTFETNGGVGASRVDFFRVPGLDSPEDRRDFLILKSLADALALLSGDAFAAAFGRSEDQDDYRWGRLHRIVFEHPLGKSFNVPPGAGMVPAPLHPLTGLPTDGGFGTVDASHHDVRAASADGFLFARGPVTRFAAVADRSGGVRAEASYPGGTSGVPGSAHAYDLLPLWLTNDTIPLRADRSDLQHAVESETLFVPSSP